MKNFVAIVLVTCLLGCGSSNDPSFAGTWSGSLVLVGNDCPFAAPLDQNQLFPVVLSPLPGMQIQAQAADGSSASGTTNEDNGSFNVSGPFGIPITNTGTYIGCTVTNNFGFYDADDSEGKSEFLINFDNCTDTTNGSTQSCGVLYSGEAQKIG